MTCQGHLGHSQRLKPGVSQELGTLGGPTVCGSLGKASHILGAWGRVPRARGPRRVPTFGGAGGVSSAECQSWLVPTDVGRGGLRGGAALKEGGPGVLAAVFPWRGEPCRAGPCPGPFPLPLPFPSGRGSGGASWCGGAARRGMALVTVRRAGGSAGGPAVSAAPGPAGTGHPDRVGTGGARGVPERREIPVRAGTEAPGGVRAVPEPRGYGGTRSSCGSRCSGEMGRSRGSRCGECGLHGDFSEPRGFPGFRKVPLSRGCQRGGGGVKVTPVAPGAGSSRAPPMGLYWEFTGNCPQHALEFPALSAGASP